MEMNLDLDSYEINHNVIQNFHNKVVMELVTVENFLEEKGYEEIKNVLHLMSDLLADLYRLIKNTKNTKPKQKT